VTDKRYMLCHFLASIAYHTQKALRDAPAGFESFRIGAKSRTPQELIRHMDSVLGYARTVFIGGAYKNTILPTMQLQVEQLHGTIEALAKHFSNGKILNEVTEEQLLQGPLSDVMTHIGQISFLRRLHGSPVPSEDFVYAKISAENLGVNQELPARPDIDWEP